MNETIKPSLYHHSRMNAMPFAPRMTDTPSLSVAERHILETMHDIPDYNADIIEGLRA